MKRISLAIFASGSGSNAQNIAEQFANHKQIEVAKIFSNKKVAFVLQRAENLGIPTTTFTREDFLNESFLDELHGIDYIILAGFLWLVPRYLVEAFPNRILNIHPALLPKYGGKGMYGDRVHQAVVEAGERESGITIHLVNEAYDEGAILFQAKCEIKGDDASSLAAKIHELEYQHFPIVIEEYVLRDS